jgi:hypothetical protein
MRFRHLIIVLIVGHVWLGVKGQDIAPQLWNNVSVGKEFGEKITFLNTASFSTLLSEEYPWDEVSLASTFSYRFHKNFWAQGTLYFARVKQTGELSNWEIRPVAGLGINSVNTRRFVITNLSRLEYRYLLYNDNTNQGAFRFRNVAIARVTLVKQNSFMDKSLTLFGYAEFFANFEDLRERFVKQAKYKLGIAYRLNYHWRFNLGVIYQDAFDNVPKPTQLPTNLITNYIIDWGIIYFITQK